ncbi:FUN14 domain-containing protein [Natronolimnobius baerhuensis]|uniref:FUN14 family protein n=1 Tax=Natronolimnobius baerhuensis TaxID=253108 RepID=A0A202ED46_9EURY|nr:FUN14 domain-containing protein [Natronolimnobius baerhuensis]OVE86161.1 hypothetical protein B2G88_05055 [Natronolimnobius baerhuensis]
MIDVDPTTLTLEFLGGAILGALVGFGTKRVAKLLAVIIGVQLMVVRYLESQEILIIDYERLTAGLIGSQEQVASAEANVHWLESILSTIPVGLGFVSGFLVGYHRG